MSIYNVQLYADCGETVKRVALELGGNAPFIVFKVDSIICNLTLSRIHIYTIFLQSNNFGLIHPPCIPCSINLTIITLKKTKNKLTIQMFLQQSADLDKAVAGIFSMKKVKMVFMLS